MKNQILVIGTIPPCPRCKLLTEILVAEIQSFGTDAEVRHIAYTSEEAFLIARELDLEPGTAKEVAKKIGQTIDLDSPNTIEIPPVLWDDHKYKGLSHLKNLFDQVNILDNRLRVYEDAAEENGILMTPVFMINGDVIYKGSVPDIDFIRSKLGEL